MPTPLPNPVALIKDDSGASAMEYALLVGLIAIAIMTGAALFGMTLSASFNTSAAKLFP